MNHLFLLHGIAVTVAMLAGLVAGPAAAAATLSNSDFLTMTNSQAEATDMPVEMPVSLEVGRSAQQPATASDLAVEGNEITAARLGVMTPYGKRALVQELRNYYPGSYRDFRSLDGVQVNELVVLFEQSGNINQVLGRMDKMGAE